MPFLNNLFSTSHIIRRWRFPCWLRGSKAKIIEKSRSNLLIGYPNPRPAHSPTSLYQRTHSLYPKAYHRDWLNGREGHSWFKACYHSKKVNRTIKTIWTRLNAFTNPFNMMRQGGQSQVQAKSWIKPTKDEKSPYYFPNPRPLCYAESFLNDFFSSSYILRPFSWKVGNLVLVPLHTRSFSFRLALFFEVT